MAFYRKLFFPPFGINNLKITYQFVRHLNQSSQKNRVRDELIQHCFPQCCIRKGEASPGLTVEERILLRPLLSIVSVANTQGPSVLTTTLSTKTQQGGRLCGGPWFGCVDNWGGVRGCQGGGRNTELNIILNQRAESDSLDYWIICEFL